MEMLIDWQYEYDDYFSHFIGIMIITLTTLLK